MWQVSPRSSWLTQGLLLCPDLLLQSLLLPNLYYSGCHRKNKHKTIHPSISLLLRWTNIFPQVSHGPWMSYSFIGKNFPCIWNLAPIVVLIEDALKLSFLGKLNLFTSHQVKQLLNGKDHLWMLAQSIHRYLVVLMENPGLTISPYEVLNPATLLPTPEALSPFTIA